MRMTGLLAYTETRNNWKIHWKTQKKQQPTDNQQNTKTEI